MIDFIDKTSEQNGTPINRENLMAMQGFVTKTTAFASDGSILEMNINLERLTTTFNPDGSITETFEGDKTIVKTTTFESNGTIKEVIS